MASLEVSFGADLSALEKGIKEAESKIKDLSKIKANKIELGLDTSDINKQISDAKKSLNELKTTLKDTGNSFASATPKIASGGNALMNFSRIAQDAPFGIIGIGNNITATAESFGHLVKETGSASSALKAVAGSIMGTGGILLAVSLVTSGLTYMAQNGLTVRDVFDKMTGTFNEFGKSLKKANEEAVGNASSSISAFKAYADAAQDANIPLEHRLIAVKKLRDIAPYYLKNLSDEKILYGDLSGVINNVTDALLAQSRAKAYGSLLDETSIKQVKLFTEIQEELNEAVKTFKIPIDQVDEFQKAIKGGTGALMRYLSSVKKAPITPSDFIDFAGLESLSQKYKDLGILNAEAYKLGLKIGSETKKGLPLDFTNTKNQPKQQKVFSTPIVTELKSFLDTNGLASTFNMASTIITTGMDKAKVAFDTGGVGIMESLQRLNEGFSDIINNGLIMTLSSMGDAIGSALASGGNVLQAAGASLLSSLGSILSQLGQMAIATGIGIKAIQVALKSLNPAVAIAAGVALVAIGGAVSAKSKSLGSSMGSGSGGGNYDTGANYSSPASGSSYSSGGGSFNGGSVVFEIEGQKLVGVLSNTLGRNTKLGGSLGI